MIVLLPTEVSDSLLYLKWQFLFQGTLIEALLSLYEKHYFDHRCRHGSHNAEKTMHRSDCAAALIAWTMFKHSKLTNVSEVQGIQMASCSLQFLEEKLSLFTCGGGDRTSVACGFWLLRLEWRWRYLSGNTMSGQWKRNDISPVKSRQ